MSRAKITQFKPTATLSLHQDVIVHFDKKIGEEPYTEIFEGYSRKTKKKLQVKFIDLSKDPSIKPIIEKEIRILKSAFGNPNVNGLMEYSQTENMVTIVTEALVGTDLATYIKNKKHIPEEQAVTFVNHIINGMKVLYTIDLCHGNLNPTNMMVHEEENKLIVKFPNFLYSDHFSKLSVESSRIPMTTLAYLPPEVLKEGKYNASAEIWSLGVIYYEMLFGKRPWPGKTKEELITNMTSNDLVFPTEPKVSDTSIDFILHCLNKRPEARPTWRSLVLHRLIFRGLFMDSDKTYSKYNEKFDQHSPSNANLTYGIRKKGTVTSTFSQAYYESNSDITLTRGKSFYSESPKKSNFNRSNTMAVASTFSKMSSKVIGEGSDKSPISSIPAVSSNRETPVTSPKGYSFTPKSTFASGFQEAAAAFSKSTVIEEGFTCEEFLEPFQQLLQEAKLYGETYELIKNYKDLPYSGELISMLSQQAKNWDFKNAEKAKEDIVNSLKKDQTVKLPVSPKAKSTNGKLVSFGSDNQSSKVIEKLLMDLHNCNYEAVDLLKIAINLRVLQKYRGLTKQAREELETLNTNAMQLFSEKKWDDLKSLLL